MLPQYLNQKRIDAMEAHIAEQNNAPIRVLIVDDHVILRQGICLMLNEEDDFEVVGEAGNGKAALKLALELQPDIILLDIFLGTSNGLDVAKQLLRSCPNTRIVLFSGFDDETLLLDAIRIGVHGYLQKTLSIDDVVSALRAVHRGERVLGDPRAITQVLEELHRVTKAQIRLRYKLNTTEIEVVRLASEGCTNKEIGTRLYWSEIQVKRKMQDIYRKLEVTDRAQAVAEAMRHGLI
jgi:NarL family two-component system response regulator LiaR